jgi:very-short-patch-repair endonuclease
MSDEGAERRHSGPKSHPEHLIALLADRQHGVVAAWQLLALGLRRDAIKYRVRIGRLHRIHHGVYAVGRRRLTREGHWMAAVLAYGPGAVLSHHSAGALWGIISGTAKIHVTIATARHGRAGIRAHRAELHEEDITRRAGVPATSLARTILDLAAVSDGQRLSRAIEQAERLELLDLRKLDRAIARRPKGRGVKQLHAVLADYRSHPVRDTRSPLEDDFLRLIKQAGLPAPSVNTLIAGHLVDASWPRWRLVVELDSRTYHSSPRAFEQDRLRDTDLQKHGWRVMRVTRRRLTSEPDQVLADLEALRRLPG